MNERKGKVQGFFSEIASLYARMYEESSEFARYPAGVARLGKALRFFQRFKPSGRVLDAGCGTGVLAIELVRLGYEVICLDFSQDMVDKAREILRGPLQRGPGKAEFEVGDVEKLDIPDASVDGVAALGLIEYLQEDDAFLAETRRVLKPDGLAVIAYPNRLFNLFSMNRFTEEELEAGHCRQLLDELRAEIADGIPSMSLQRYAGNVVARADSRPPRKSETTKEGRLFGPLPVKVRRPTPREARESAARFGFRCLGLAYFHFHPFPPVFEAVEPEIYNWFGVAMEALDETPVGACMASGFVAAYAKVQ